MQKYDILGVGVANITLREATDLIIGWVEERRSNPGLPPRHIVTINPEYIMATRRDRAFYRLVTAADMVTPDGVGIILAGRILRKPFRGRVTGVALTEALLVASAQHKLRIFLLGAAPGVAEEAAEIIRKQYPGVHIVGTWAGNSAPEGDAESLDKIRLSGAEIILVAYGMVKQDWWVARNLITTGASVAIGIGGVLDYKAGRIPLAPSWMRRTGFEWLYRLYKEPWRWRRQMALPRFVLAVLKQATSRASRTASRK